MDWAMDWDLAIKRNSEALKRIVEALFAMLGLVGEAVPLARPPASAASAPVAWPGAADPQARI